MKKLITYLNFFRFQRFLKMSDRFDGNNLRPGVVAGRIVTSYNAGIFIIILGNGVIRSMRFQVALICLSACKLYAAVRTGVDVSPGVTI